MNSAPPLLVTAFAVFVGLVAVGRWLLVNESSTDQLLNRALAWDIGAVVLFGCTAGLGHPELGQRLFLGVSVMVLSKCIGFARLLDDADLRVAEERQRTYDRGAIVFGIVVVLLAVADEFGLRLHRVVDWEAILWAATGPYVFWIGMLFARVGLRELLGGVSTSRERLTYSALLFLGCYIMGSTIYTFMMTATGTVPGRPGTIMAVASLVAVTVFVLLIAVPLFEALLLYARLDLDSRRCRRLNPLWRDLTEVVPEVVLHAHRPRDSSSRLYRMTVEIRDALMHLKQFMPDADATRGNDISTFALRIAEAVHRRRSGMPTFNSSVAVHLPADDRAAELRNLLALSRAWPHARAAVQRGHTSLAGASNGPYSRWR
jgi:hypothetical protein